MAQGRVDAIFSEHFVATKAKRASSIDACTRSTPVNRSRLFINKQGMASYMYWGLAGSAARKAEVSHEMKWCSTILAVRTLKLLPKPNRCAGKKQLKAEEPEAFAGI